MMIQLKPLLPDTWFLATLFIHWLIHSFIYWLHCVANGILVLQPRVEPVPSPVEVQDLNHWTTREVPLTALHVVTWSTRLLETSSILTFKLFGIGEITYKNALRMLFCCCLVAKSCPTLCNPIDCSPSGSSVHGISQARIVERTAIFFCRGSFWSKDRTHISCIGRWVLYRWATREVLYYVLLCYKK